MLHLMLLGLALAAAPSSTPSPVPDASPAAQDQAPVVAPAVSGVVRDADGGAVAGATVVVRSISGAELQTETAPDGRFSIIASGSEPVLLIVRARGFAEARLSLGPPAPSTGLQIALAPASIAETVTVTPTRTEQEVGTVAASVNVLDRDAIRRSPAALPDDVLRQIPTFSLFRRTSSLASHPTAQGVSLRGIGPSGVSRTLVLLDGVPFNDPFGGWVYWTRLPFEAADRVEVVDGATSSLYGNYAMGGVINVLTAPPSPRQVLFKAQYGNLNTPQFDVVASDVFGRLGVVVNASAFDTEGYEPVVAGERGVVDTNASVSYKNLGVKLQYDVSPAVRGFLRANYFRENRDNGKISTFDGAKEANRTRWASVAAGFNVRLRDGSEAQTTLFIDSEKFRSGFLAVPASDPPRSIGRMSLLQTVPSTSVGWSGLWSRAYGSQHKFSAGADLRWVKGESQEQVLDFARGATPVTDRFSGGRQRSFGLFAQDLVAVSEDLTVTLSGRLDHWSNYDGHNLETSIATGEPTAGNVPALPDRSDTVFSPRIAASYRLDDRTNVWASLGSGFRAPTLNELYRQFRVGSVLTLANSELGPERLVGAELGIRVAPLPNVIWRATWFGNRITDPVSNVTLSSEPGLVTRQRQNLGATRVFGLQTDVEYRFSPRLTVTGAYVYDHATISEFEENPAIIGNTLPQVPRHRMSIGVTYTDPRYATVELQIQGIGRQFDDDENATIVPGYDEPGLPPYGLVSFSASRALSPTLELFVAAQNLFDQQYYVGTLPTTIGSPRLVSAGVRLRISDW